jgi:hypothetical protein
VEYIKDAHRLQEKTITPHRGKEQQLVTNIYIDYLSSYMLAKTIRLDPKFPDWDGRFGKYWSDGYKNF